jgi:hypothetical protein
MQGLFKCMGIRENTVHNKGIYFQKKEVFYAKLFLIIRILAIGMTVVATKLCSCKTYTVSQHEL